MRLMFLTMQALTVFAFSICASRTIYNVPMLSVFFGMCAVVSALLLVVLWRRG